MIANCSTIFLVGPPGAGKTSVGKLLAQRLGWRFDDTDRLIEESTGEQVSRIFANQGEPAFRKMETQLLEQLASQDCARRVLATGGGIITTAGNYELMKKTGAVVCLQASVDTLAQRLADDNTRPLLAAQQNDAPAPQQRQDREDSQSILVERLSRLVSDRHHFYDMAEVQVATDGFSTEQVADQICRLLVLM